jgi:inositol oxygenase
MRRYGVVSSYTEKQTMDFNIKVRVKFNAQKRARMGVWEAMEMLNTLVDESDPDVSIRQFPSRRQCAYGIIIL